MGFTVSADARTDSYLQSVMPFLFPLSAHQVPSKTMADNRAMVP